MAHPRTFKHVKIPPPPPSCKGMGPSSAFGPLTSQISIKDARIFPSVILLLKFLLLKLLNSEISGEIEIIPKCNFASVNCLLIMKNLKEMGKVNEFLAGGLVNEK